MTNKLNEVSRSARLGSATLVTIQVAWSKDNATYLDPTRVSHIAETIASALEHTTEHLATRFVRDAPLVLAAPEYCILAATEFVQRWSATGRVRPSASLDLEPTRLIQTFASRGLWHGACFVIVTPRRAALQAFRWALGLVRSGQDDLVLVCELARDSRGFIAAATAIGVESTLETSSVTIGSSDLDVVVGDSFIEGLANHMGLCFSETAGKVNARATHRRELGTERLN